MRPQLQLGCGRSWKHPIWLAHLSGGLAALALAALATLILGEITIRLLSNYFAGLPAGIPTAWEVSSYLMGTAFMTGSAMTLRGGRPYSRIGVAVTASSEWSTRIGSFRFSLRLFVVHILSLFASAIHMGQFRSRSDIHCI